MVFLVRFWLFISQAIATIFLAAMVLIIGYGANVANSQGGELPSLQGSIGVMGGWSLLFIFCSVRAWVLLKKEEYLRQAAIVTALPVLFVPVALFLMR
ncbi:hypothetical protein NG798_04045 [Ancylothrix sp. C2]|uniref:hypothetical protein n=1 Tax=Ancylothrix sp. D3o TaxID=2953691 RepID=UPI0021BAA4A2|nr:hypothetical protein [Ancylothrix sp. D3o]MCT7948949.1 hypothetical protein [Ancylothrix sp. D3o]